MTKPEIADMIDQFVKHVDNCLAWDIARQKHGQAAKDGCLSELQAEALTNADYNSTMAKTALLLSGKLLAPELDRYGEDSAIFRGLLNSIDALDTTYESACGRGVGIRICNSGIDRLNVVHESWPNVKIQLEIIAARFRCIEDEPADTKDTMTERGKRGRKKLSINERKKRLSVLGKWDRAREAEISRDRFCTDNRISIKELENYQDWNRQCKNRGQ